MKFKGKWLPEKASYKDACVRLSKDLSNFKRDQDYIAFVGNDTRGADVVKAFDEVVINSYIFKNDSIGNPILHNDKSAGTLRFMKVVEDIDTDVYNPRIVEVGAGYGGQCLVFKEMLKCSYTIIDISEALKLSKAYLKVNDVECSFINANDVPFIDCDILISDYCISEFNNDGVDFYLDRIKFDYGYFALNGNVDYIASALNERGYKVTIKHERPKTSHHDNYLMTAKKI